VKDKLFISYLLEVNHFDDDSDDGFKVDNGWLVSFKLFNYCWLTCAAIMTVWYVIQEITMKLRF